jgi:hypothetical protein
VHSAVAAVLGIHATPLLLTAATAETGHTRKFYGPSAFVSFSPKKQTLRVARGEVRKVPISDVRPSVLVYPCDRAACRLGLVDGNACISPSNK